MVEKHGTITDTCKALLKEKIADFQKLTRSSKQAMMPVQVNKASKASVVLAKAKSSSSESTPTSVITHVF